jgi:hypothetical protein
MIGMLTGRAITNIASTTVIAIANAIRVKHVAAVTNGLEWKKELHMTPNVGSIGLVPMPGLVGKGIRLGQWVNGDGFENYQHAFTYVGYDQIIEAMPGGALLSRLDKYDPDSVRWLQCPTQYGLDVASAALNYQGIPYSFLDYGAIALHRFHVSTDYLQTYIASTGHMICSQLADRAAMDGGWHLFSDERWEGFVTPLDIENLIP